MVPVHVKVRVSWINRVKQRRTLFTVTGTRCCHVRLTRKRVFEGLFPAFEKFFFYASVNLSEKSAEFPHFKCDLSSWKKLFSNHPQVGIIWNGLSFLFFFFIFASISSMKTLPLHGNILSYHGNKLDKANHLSAKSEHHNNLFLSSFATDLKL